MKQIFMIFALMGFIVSTPVSAQSKKELSAQNAALAQRLATLERRMLTGDPAAERLIQRMDGLETSQRNLTGEIERLRFERETLRNELTALIEDVAAMQALSNRIKIHLDAVDLVAKEQAMRGPMTSTQPRIYGEPDTLSGPQQAYTNSGIGNDLSGDFSATPQAPSQLSQVPNAPTFKETTIPIQQSYNEMSKLPEQGRQKLAEGDFFGAQSNFKQYLDFNPDAEDAGEVNFWLAETYFVRGNYTDAADSYIASMRKDPAGLKAPEAMVGLAATLRSLGKTAEACQALASFPIEYPDAPQRVREKSRVEAARTGC